MTHEQFTPASVEVTQADREAASKLVGLPENPADVDNDPAVQAFARHRIAHSAPADLVELVEAAWRAGFQTARDCLPDDAADVLTEDVEHDQWLDSNTRAALAKHGGA